MTLRNRLAISHFLVIVVFAIVFISIVMMMTGGFGPSRGAQASRDRIFEAVKDTSSLAELRRGLAALHLPPEFDVSIRDTDGVLVAVSGTVHVGRTQSFVETIPMQNGDLKGSTLEIRAFRPRPQGGALWNPLRDLLLAASIAGLVGVGFSIIVSRFVSEPVAALAAAVEKFEGQPLTERLQSSGPPEIKELAETFNEMAGRLSSSMDELRLQKEEAERSELSRRQFLGEVSHNLRTPLAAIMGWTEALLDDLAKGDERAFLKRIRRETRYVSTTIDRLLDLSRWERARPMLHVETFALTEVLMETAENLEEAAAEKSIELNLDLPEATCWVEADRHRVRDLFQILLENVVEHAGNGVRVEVAVKLADDRYWVSVTDNGKGLPDSLKTGWRGDPLVAATGRASLGLAIANHLVKAHDGELRLGSGLHGIGTKASFSLPFAPINAKLRSREPGFEIVRVGAASPLA